MKLGLRLPQGAGVNLQVDIVDAARMAEAIGYTSLWTFERLLAPVAAMKSYPEPGYEGKPWPEAQREIADAPAVLTAAAAVTSQVRLGTSVLIAPAHAPFQLARTLATIDRISGGRMIAGMAPGGRSTSCRRPAPRAPTVVVSSTCCWAFLMPSGVRIR